MSISVAPEKGEDNASPTAVIARSKVGESALTFPALLGGDSESDLRFVW